MKKGFIQVIPLIFITILAVSTLVIVNRVQTEQQEIRSRAAFQAPEMESGPPAQGLCSGSWATSQSCANASGIPVSQQPDSCGGRSQGNCSALSACGCRWTGSSAQTVPSPTAGSGGGGTGGVTPKPDRYVLDTLQRKCIRNPNGLYTLTDCQRRLRALLSPTPKSTKRSTPTPTLIEVTTCFDFAGDRIPCEDCTGGFSTVPGEKLGRCADVFPSLSPTVTPTSDSKTKTCLQGGDCRDGDVCAAPQMNNRCSFCPSNKSVTEGSGSFVLRRCAASSLISPTFSISPTVTPKVTIIPTSVPGSYDACVNACEGSVFCVFTKCIGRTIPTPKVTPTKKPTPRTTPTPTPSPVEIPKPTTYEGCLAANSCWVSTTKTCILRLTEDSGYCCFGPNEGTSRASYPHFEEGSCAKIPVQPTAGSVVASIFSQIKKGFDSLLLLIQPSGVPTIQKQQVGDEIYYGEYQETTISGVAQRQARPDMIIIHTDDNAEERPSVLSTINSIGGRQNGCQFAVGYDRYPTADNEGQQLPIIVQTVPLTTETTPLNHCATDRQSALNIEIAGTPNNVEQDFVPVSVSLTVELMIQYNLPLSQVYGHYEQSEFGKADPGEEFMENFRSEVRKELIRRGRNDLI